jgi:hypothetical protein
VTMSLQDTNQQGVVVISTGIEQIDGTTWAQGSYPAALLDPLSRLRSLMSYDCDNHYRVGYG